MANSSVIGETLAGHPYFPLGVAMPDYVANTISSPALVGYFAAGCAVILGTAITIIRRVRPTISSGDTWTALWFVLCGFIHFFFEGYFSYNFQQMASRTDLFGQLWKEYALSDSRYLTLDSFVMCMETITAFFWGPMSFFIVYAIVARHPLRHPLTVIVSLGQVYGDVLYYGTCSFAEIIYSVRFCRPEAFYFYMYYVLMNAFWIVIPMTLIVKSVRETARVFAKVQQIEGDKKGQ